MVLTDPIADMLTRIRNANMAGKKVVQMPHSKMKSEIARILKAEGFIKDYTTENDGGKSVLNVFLKFTVDREPIIQGMRRISKSSCRKYANATEIPRVLGGIGLAILSTSSGVITDKEARQKNVGGEVLCYVW